MRVPSAKAATVAAALTIAALAGCTSPHGLTETTGPAASLSAADRNFIPQAAYGGLGEVAAGSLAQKMGSSPDVRAFGAMMVDEHGKANSDLVSVARAKGVTPPTSPDPGRLAVTEMLGKLSGNTFDQEYVAQQLADHEVSATLYRTEAMGGSDPDLRAFAQRTLPVIERHIEMLKKLHVQTVSTGA